MKRCAVLFVDTRAQESPHTSGLRKVGLLVHECREWPEDAAIREHHVVIVRAHVIAEAPMLAARLRAKPHFGRRLLFALVDRAAGAAQQRSLEASGFDAVMDDRCETQALATRILRGLRGRPELQCTVPPLPRRSAA
jgi:hypothetical protein